MRFCGEALSRFRPFQGNNHPSNETMSRRVGESKKTIPVVLLNGLMSFLWKSFPPMREGGNPIEVSGDASIP